MKHFKGVEFDADSKTMTILQGTQGTFPYSSISSCKVLNENKKYHGKGEPFAVTVPNGPLPRGMIFERALYVGIKVIMKDGSVLAIYTSDQPTRINTDLFNKDKEEAERIKKYIDRIIQKYSTSE